MDNIGKEKKSDALYRKEHWFALKLKNQMYRRLSHVKERRQGSRSEYYKEYYKKNKMRIIKNVSDWSKEHKDKKRLYQQKYKDKVVKRQNENRSRADRKFRLVDLFTEFVEYTGDRYQKVTVRLRSANMRRFFDYLDYLEEERKRYRSKYFKEHGALPGEDDPGLRGFKKVKYVYEVDRDVITRYVSYVNTEAISRRTGIALTQSEKEQRLTALRAFLKFCQKKGYINEDLARFVIFPKREKGVLKRVLTVEEMERLLDAPDTNTAIGIRVRALLELSYSGLRADEMLSLKVENVDVVDNRVMVLNGKGDKDRVVPMTQECLYWMKRWLARRKEFIGDKNDPGYVFITNGMRPVLRANFARWLRRYAKEAGILLDISPHDLRRTTATHLAKNGAPIRQIQALLGHASLKVTTRYLRLTDEEIKEEYVRSHPSNRRSLHYGRI